MHLNLRPLFGAAAPVLSGLAFLPYHEAAGSLIVNPPLEITHKVIVQPIVVESSEDDIAIFMGDAASEAYMKEQINRVWAQLGIEIEWLDAVSYVDDFAYDGYPEDYGQTPRPQTHLITIVGSAGSPPKSTNGAVLNLFFTDISAGFHYLGDYSAAGVAFRDGNGSTIAIGQGLVTWETGRDAAASVIAHEIGHNLGLPHFASDNQNLLFSGNRSASRLYEEQLVTILDDNPGGVDGYDFLQPVPQDSNYTEWASLNNLVEGPGGDDDGDRLSNGFEYLCGSSPKTFDSMATGASTAPGGMVWTMPKVQGAVEDGFSYLVEGTTDLNQWLPADDAGSPVSILSESDTSLEVLLSNNHSHAFVRFGVEVPPAIESSATIFIPAESAAPNEHSCCAGDCGTVTLLPP